MFIRRNIIRVTVFRETGKEPIAFVATNLKVFVFSVSLAVFRPAGSQYRTAVVRKSIRHFFFRFGDKFFQVKLHCSYPHKTKNAQPKPRMKNA